MTTTKHGALIGVDLGGTKVAAGRINGNIPDAVLKKFIPAQSMKKTMIHSTAGEANSPTEVFLVENPPVARVVKAWQIAS